MTRFGTLLVLALMLPLCRAEKDPAAFKFGKVEREVLEETKSVEELFRGQGVLLKDRDLDGWLTRIGTALVGQQPPLENVTFRFAALQDQIANVIALPNGSIYVTTGMLATLENEEQLAGVIAHGIAEVTDRQTYSFLKTFRKKMIAASLLAAPFPGSFLYAGSFMARLSGGPALQAAMASGYGEKLEREAGQSALKRMHAAGYDPQALPRALHLLAASASSERTRFRYDSRTSLTAREQALRGYAVAPPLNAGSGGSAEDYLAHAEPAIALNVQAEIAARNPQAALAQARRLASWKQEPRCQLLLADSFLALKDHGQAEPVYRGVIAREPSLAEAHRGLGLLLEQDNRKDEAAAEYRRYLDLAPPEALGRRRIERRLAMLSASAQDEVATLQRACVVPADVQVKRSWIEDAEAFSEQTAAWQEQLAKLVVARLTGAGVEIVPFRSTPAELLEVRAAYNLVADDLEEHSKDVKKGQFTIDDAVAVLPCAAAADAVVFIRGRSEALGKKMKLGWGDADPLHISFVDARSGRVFDQFRVFAEGDTSDTERILGPDLEKRIKKIKKQR